MPRLTVVWIALAASAASAWGPAGHIVIGRIAEARLSPAARALVTRTLDPEANLSSVADWADDIREPRPETAPWHFINSPISRGDVNLARDCRKGNCILARLAALRADLANPATKPRQRKEALLFVVHLIGDLHQPLHVADNGDHGGNDTQVSYFGQQMSLHQLWDNGLLHRIGRIPDLLRAVSAEVAAGDPPAWEQGSLESWAQESHDAARAVAYRRLPRAPKGTVLQLGQPYADFAEPLVRVQLARAGVRLAAVLNQAAR